MSTCVVTGAAGLVGAETVRYFGARGFRVLGVDNDLRRSFFGDEASTAPGRRALEAEVAGYVHHDVDIRDRARIEALFAEHGGDIAVVVHAAAQPSHEWAARDPHTDFAVNAVGTLNLLEAARVHCPRASFLFTSTNKVYGDHPNALPLVEEATRWEVAPDHPYREHGIDEALSVDRTTHSLFGVSKLAADAMVQEYGRYFGMNTVCFRGGCLTGPGHSGTMMHGFLSYLVRCALTGRPYTILGHKGKQVRDNLHSLDLVRMFWHYHQAPRPGEVYNAGGGRFSHCSMREAIAIIEARLGRTMTVRHDENARIGDHIWYVSDTRRFRAHYPGWHQEYDVPRIIDEIIASMSKGA